MGMINYETILSSYDDKLTLMQWLKKVEEALKNASATAFSVNKKGNATISFILTFEDGTSLESGDIVLQQGESVASAYITGGNLHLVLTNGDDIDAGNLFNGNVSINGNFEVTGHAKLPNIEGDENNNINVDGNVIVSDGGISVADGAVSTPILTSQNDHIEAQKPVIEVMEGYSAQVQAPANVDIEMVYLGCSKNGNKLTIVHAFNITKHAGAAANSQISRITIPSAVGAKIYPVSIGAYDYVDNKGVQAFSNYDAYVNTTAYVQKYSNTRLDVSIRGNNMVDDTKYFVRYETTILLSENLAA